MSDFTPVKISFDSKECMDCILSICQRNLDELSRVLQIVVAKQIWENGNGSTVMKLDAVSNIKETDRKITDDKIILEVGIDTNALKDNNELYARICVVLHGNMMGSNYIKQMYTKPGEETFGKNVSHKKIHVPGGFAPRPLPLSFSQPNVYIDIKNGISHNIESEMKKYVDAFITSVSNEVNNLDWSSFITVG